jgi:hypothetical protein
MKPAIYFNRAQNLFGKYATARSLCRLLNSKPCPRNTRQVPEVGDKLGMSDLPDAITPQEQTMNLGWMPDLLGQYATTRSQDEPMNSLPYACITYRIPEAGNEHDKSNAPDATTTIKKRTCITH